MIHLTIHRPEAYNAYERKLAEMQKQLDAKQYEAYQMSLYADQYLRALDELKRCQKLMKKAGMDTSFICSLRSHK